MHAEMPDGEGIQPCIHRGLPTPGHPYVLYKFQNFEHVAENADPEQGRPNCLLLPEAAIASGSEAAAARKSRSQSGTLYFYLQ